MAHNKNHHIVPTCYLDGFTSPDGFNWNLTNENKIFKTKPENNLKINQFYTIKLKSGERDLFIEDTLTNIEGIFKSIYSDKVSQCKPLTIEEKAKLAVFVAAQYIRTQAHREALKRGLGSLKEQMEEWSEQFKKNKKLREFHQKPPSSKDNRESINIEDMGDLLNNFDEQHSIMLIENLPEISQIIFNMKWSIWTSNGEEFVTSDDPVTVMRPESIKKFGKGSFGSAPGLVYEDSELTFPLSKKQLLLAGWRLNQDSYLDVDNERVGIMNQRTILNSSKRVISSNEEKVKEIMMKYPPKS